MTATARHVRLGAGGEFDLIRGFLADQGEALPPDVLLGPGDDAALLAGGGEPWAVTCDMAVEDVHFRRAWLEPGEIGWRAAASALSDLAAMAARPVAVLLSLAVPTADARSGLARAVVAGVGEACASVGAALVGGDLTRSPGPIALDVTALGRTARAVGRDGALPGDELWVTGLLGGAGAAVAAWERGERPPPGARRAYAHPHPRVEEARWLAATGRLHAMLDLSDGLAGDAGHLAAASGVALVLVADLVPVAADVATVVGDGTALGVALSAGEDYELLLAAQPGALEPLRGGFEERFGVPLTRVGAVEAGQDVHLERKGGRRERLEAGGFDHFVAEGKGGR